MEEGELQACQETRAATRVPCVSLSSLCRPAWPGDSSSGMANRPSSPTWKPSVTAGPGCCPGPPQPGVHLPVSDRHHRLLPWLPHTRIHRAQPSFPPGAQTHSGLLPPADAPMARAQASPQPAGTSPHPGPRMSTSSSLRMRPRGFPAHAHRGWRLRGVRGPHSPDSPGGSDVQPVKKPQARACPPAGRWPEAGPPQMRPPIPTRTGLALPRGRPGVLCPTARMEVERPTRCLK